MADHATFVDNLITAANRIISSWLNDINNYVYRGSRPVYATTTGAANVYLLTLPGISLFTSAGLTAGDTFIFKAHQTNTTAATFSIAGSTTTPPAAFQIAGNALIGGEILQNGVYSATWTGVAWQLQNMLVVPFAVSLGGTGLTTMGAAGSLLLSSSASALTAFAVGTDGYVLTSLSGATNKLAYLPTGIGTQIENGYLDWTVSGNAMTCALKGLDGNDPSATNPVYVWMRSATATTGAPSKVKITAATSIVVSSGSTLGTTNAVTSRIWAVLFDDAGTYRLGVMNASTVSSGSLAQYPLAGWSIASSTAEGGAGAADSAQTFYTGTAVTAKAYTTLGWAEFTEATAGTWATAAARKHLQKQGDPLPGTVIQAPRSQTGAVTTGTTEIPQDDTAPTSSEGDQYMSQAITPSSLANILRVTVSAGFGHSVASSQGTGFIVQDSSGSIATSNAGGINVGVNQRISINMIHLLVSGTITATTFKFRYGCASGTGGTNTFNGSAGGRFFAGTFASFLQVEEIVA